MIIEVDEEHAHDNGSEMYRHSFLRTKSPSENQEVDSVSINKGSSAN